MNFILFKRRQFGDYVSDTFGFFKQTGKHYLSNYFTISGILLLVLVVMSYFLFNVYFDFFMRIDQTGNNADFLEGYLSNNLPVVIIVAILLFLFMIFLSMLSYSIPVIYLDLYEKNNGSNFGSKEILTQFKARFGKVLAFFLGTLFVITPMLMIVFTVLFLLCFIIIGIPLMLFAIPTVFCWVALSFYEYLNSGKGFFESYGAGLKHLKNQYFPIVGACMIIYIIMQITMSVFTMIPYFFGIFSMITATQNPETAGGDPFSTFRIMMTIVMVFSILMSYIMNNLLLINQGLVYYSRKEHDENKSADFSIDLIGSE